MNIDPSIQFAASISINEDGAVTTGIGIVTPRALETNAVYEGKDPYLFVKVCAHCHATNPKHVCSRCHLVQYCSPECQRSNYRTHKDECKRIHHAVEEKERSKGPGQDVNVRLRTFQIEACLLRIFALRHNTKLVLEKSLKSELELSGRLGIFHEEKGPLDSFVPFVLLMLNRDDDAFQYCKFLTSSLSLGTNPDPKWTMETLLAKQSIYPDEESSRFRDFFQDLACVDPNKMQLRYLLTICIIKMRIVAKHEDAKRHGLPIDDELLAVQRSQMEKLVSQIDSNDPRVLALLLNRSISMPSAPHEPMTFEEYHIIAKICILRVPGAMAWLESLHGNFA